MYQIKTGCEAAYGAKEAHAVANAEFVRYALFLINDAMAPPKYTTLELNIGDSVVTFPPDRWAELPHHEPCINVLMDMVDVSKIIDLWMGILLERQIIIMSRQNYVQFAICEALRMLLYPLKWCHVFIPVVGDTNYLESPVPYLMGVNTVLTTFEEAVALASSAIVLDVDSGKFFCGKMPRICCKEEAKLREELFAIKAHKYQNIDQAKINSKAMPAEPLSDESRAQRFRSAFLNVFFSNMQHYQACIIHDKDKFRYEFAHKNFIMYLTKCDNPKCKSSKFWTDAVDTAAFGEFVGDSTTFDESNTSNFNMMLDKLYPSEKRHGVTISTQGYHSETVTISLKPLYSPKVFFDLLNSRSKIDEFTSTPEEAGGKTISPEDSRKYWKHTYDLLERLPYFSLDGESGLEDMLSHIRPGSLPAEARFARRYSSRDPDNATMEFHTAGEESSQTDVHSNLIYGTDGLIRFCKFVVNTIKPVKLVEVNAWGKLQEWLQSLISESPQWQYYILLSYLYEFMNHPEEDRLDLVLKAYELNENSLPSYRFTQMLENLGGRDKRILDRIKQYHGKANDILKKVEDLLARDHSLQIPFLVLPSPESTVTSLVPPSASVDDLTPRSNSSRRTSKRKQTMDGHKPADVQNLLVIKPDSLNESSQWAGLPRAMNVVIESLMETLIQLIDSIIHKKPKCLVQNKKRATLKAFLNTSAIMTKLQTDVCELQAVTVPRVDEENYREMLSFFLNLHNLTVVFGIFKKQKFPGGPLEWNEMLGKTYMRVAGSCISPFLIETQVLKSTSGFTDAPSTQDRFTNTGFQDTDCPWEFPDLNPLINFGLYIPTPFSPPLRIFHPDTVFEELENAAKSYLRDVSMDVGQGEYVLTAPPLFISKKADFGDDEGVKQLIMSNGPEIVCKLLASRRNAKIKYQLRDWNFSIRPEDVVAPNSLDPAE